MSLLLDTHVVLWLATDPSRVPDAVRQRVSEETGPVFVSAVVMWEVAIKSAYGKLKADDDFPSRVYEFDFARLPITDAHAWAVRSLPLVHRDPFDRLLVAQALTERATLVTKDAALSQYDVPVLWS